MPIWTWIERKEGRLDAEDDDDHDDDDDDDGDDVGDDNDDDDDDGGGGGDDVGDDDEYDHDHDHVDDDDDDNSNDNNDDDDDVDDVDDDVTDLLVGIFNIQPEHLLHCTWHWNLCPWLDSLESVARLHLCYKILAPKFHPRFVCFPPSIRSFCQVSGEEREWGRWGNTSEVSCTPKAPT